MVKDNENVKIESALLLKCGCSIVVIICGSLLLSCGWNGMKNVIYLPVSEGKRLNICVFACISMQKTVSLHDVNNKLKEENL